MSYKIEECILIAIDKAGVTKKSVYDGLGMSANGFSEMIKRHSIKVQDLIRIADILGMNPQDFFIDTQKTDNVVKQSKAKYLVQQNGNGSNHASIDENKNLKDEVEFLRKQVEMQAKIIENLTTK